MKPGILIVEDAVLVAEELKENLEEMGFSVVALATDFEEALAAFQEYQPDIVLLDIHLGQGPDGIAVGQAMKAIRPCPLIFLTAHSSPAYFDRAKALQPNAYLIKPYSAIDVRLAIDLALHSFAGGQESSAQPATAHRIAEHIFIKSGIYFQKIPLSQIQYVKAAGSYVEVVTLEEKHLLTMNLNAFLKRVSSPKLLRIHRSYALHLDKIDKVGPATVFVMGQEIPVGPSYKQGLWNALELL